MSPPLDPTPDPLGFLKSISMSQFSKHLAEMDRVAAMIKEVSSPFAATEMLKIAEANQRLAESLQRVSLARPNAFTSHILQMQEEAKRWHDGLFGPGSRMHVMAESVRLTGEKYNSLFGPTSELAKTFAFTDEYVKGFRNVANDLADRVVPFARAITEFGTTFSEGYASLPGSPEVRRAQEIIRSIHTGLQPLAGLDPATLNSFRDLDILGLQSLAGHLHELADPPHAMGASGFNDDNAEVSQQDIDAVQEVIPAVTSTINARFDALDVRIDRTNEAVEAIGRQLRSRPSNSKIVKFVLVLMLNVLINIGSAYIFEHLRNADRAVGTTSSGSTRPGDIVREARRAVSEVGTPSQVARRFRVVKRKSVVVYGEVGGCLVPVARLGPGKIVEIKGTFKKWRCITWTPSDDELQIDGWVRAKYLGKVAGR